MNFTAIDFETATPLHKSICQVGLVRVENSIIIEKYMSLIKPPDNEYTYQNMKVHGILAYQTDNAPLFSDVWKRIKHHIEGELVVCHNSSFDITKLVETLRHYQLEIPYFEVDCTFKIFGSNLKDCCSENGIEFYDHHDALADAEACAKLYLLWKGELEQDHSKNDFNPFEKKSVEKDDLVPDFNNCDNSNPLFMKKVVFTGDLFSMDRKQAAHYAKIRGADVNTAISKKTDFVIVGQNPGPSKMEKILEFNIPIISEDEFLVMIEEG
jgi:DNA polymerase III subunit epsilon